MTIKRLKIRNFGSLDECQARISALKEFTAGYGPEAGFSLRLYTSQDDDCTLVEVWGFDSPEKEAALSDTLAPILDFSADDTANASYSGKYGRLDPRDALEWDD